MDMPDYTNWPVNNTIYHIDSYRITDYSGGNLGDITEEEVANARALALDALSEENLAQYDHELVLLTEKGEKDFIIHAIVANEQLRYDGNESRNRTFYIKANKIFRVHKGTPKNASTPE